MFPLIIDERRDAWGRNVLNYNAACRDNTAHTHTQFAIGIKYSEYDIIDRTLASTVELSYNQPVILGETVGSLYLTFLQVTTTVNSKYN